jgi:hypothetical protein
MYKTFYYRKLCVKLLCFEKFMYTIFIYCKSYVYNFYYRKSYV